MNEFEKSPPQSSVVPSVVQTCLVNENFHPEERLPEDNNFVTVAEIHILIYPMICYEFVTLYLMVH